MAEVKPLQALQRYFSRRAQREQQFRQQVHARNVDDVNELSHLSDSELIAADRSIPSARNQMELTRRLKAAIEDLTTVTVQARRSSDRASALLVLLTFALVALTVVLAVKS